MSDETRGDSKETRRLLRKNQRHVDDSCCFFHTAHVKCLLLWTVDCALLGLTDISAQASLLDRWTDKEEA